MGGREEDNEGNEEDVKREEERVGGGTVREGFGGDICSSRYDLGRIVGSLVVVKMGWNSGSLKFVGLFWDEREHKRLFRPPTESTFRKGGTVRRRSTKRLAARAWGVRVFGEVEDDDDDEED